MDEKKTEGRSYKVRVTENGIEKNDSGRSDVFQSINQVRIRKKVKKLIRKKLKN